AVLKNEMGRVHLNSSLRLAGDLLKPRVEGDLGIASGRLELDPLLAVFANSPTAPAAPAANDGDSANQDVETPAAQAPPSGSLFDRVQMDVQFKVPDDLVVRGSELKPAGAPVGLGAANFTVGGDLHAQKDPGDALRITGTVNTVRGTYEFQG